MSDEQKKLEITAILPTRNVASTNLPIFYTNIAGLVVSPEEVAINFGLVNPDNPEEIFNIVRIYMSPGHAKRLALALQRTIDQYEQTFGVLPDPESFITPEMRK